MPSPSERRNFTLGIFGSNGKTSTSNMLYCIFNSAGFHVERIYSKNYVTDKRIMPNIEPNKKLKNMDNNGIIIVEINEEMLNSSELYDMNFDVLIHCHISDESFESTVDGAMRISSLINSSSSAKAVIINTDDCYWRNLSIDVQNICLITYGLGSKATVTASSIECGKKVDFLYCLQRLVTGYNGCTMVPMEIPVSLNVMGLYNVYNGLAAITAALYYGMSPDDVIPPLKTNINGTGPRILYENGFSVIHNVCNNIMSYESGFEAIQNLLYKNLHLAFNLDSNNRAELNEKIIDLIGAWSLTLKIKNIYFFHNNQCKLLPDSMKSLGSLSKLECLEGSIDNIEGIINSLKDDDMLLFFCSSSFNSIMDKVIEILDKRILGILSEYNT